MGIPLRDIIYNYGGGILGDKKLKAVIPGGISAKILTANEIDVKMDYDSLRNAGTMLGSAGIMVMDETVCMVKMLVVACKFFAHESCGQCSPCREGTGWAYKIVKRIYHGEGSVKDLDNLLQIARNMEGRTICVFADAAAWPIQSYITKFRSEFEEYILNGKHSHRRETVHS
jgi:NADH-quinone oxidoreductase subunit F